MGLKSGSRDAGLDDESADTNQSDGQRTDEPKRAPEEPTDTTTAEGDEEPPSTTGESDSQRLTMESIPYKLRREKVNEGREQVPYFLRAEVIDAEDELQGRLEELLGESVYKSDYREAAMVVAQRNPELIAAVLREWGYDLEDAR